MVPWRGGKVLVCDATCADSLAPSYTTLAARETRAVAANAEQRKHSKYSHLDATHHLVPIATKTLGAIGDEGRAFLRNSGDESKLLHKNHSHISMCYKECQWQFREAMLSPYWVRWGEVTVGSFNG